MLVKNMTAIRISTIVGLFLLLNWPAGQAFAWLADCGNLPTRRVILTGKVNNKWPVLVDFSYKKNDAKKHVVVGKCIYTNHGKPLSLDGKASHLTEDTDGKVEPLILTEKDTSGVETGVWSIYPSNGGPEWLGTWTDPAGKRKYTVKLEAVAEYDHASRNIKRVVAETSTPYLLSQSHPLAKPLQELSVETRRDAHAFVDKSLKREPDAINAQHYPAHYKSLEWQIDHIDRHVVSMRLMKYSYQAGAAHGSYSYRSRTIAITDGVSKQIKLADIFDKESEWEKALRKLIAEDLVRQKALWPPKPGEDSYADLINENVHAFTIGPHGLKFYYSAYHFSSWSRGSFYVYIPWASISNYVDRDGVAARWVN